MIARPGQTLTWDVLSNLTTLVAGSATTTYLYDDAGQRYAEITPAKVTVYQGAWEATDPSPGATGTTDVTVTRYYTAGGTQLASKTTGGTLLVMVGDVQGSARVTVDSSGTTTTNTYTPYGTTRAGSSVTSAHGWLNQIADPTGLTYLNARYYDPMLGRFLSPDPLMNVGDPRTLDPYRYADNNPAMFTDPTGLAACGPYNASTASCWESFIGVTTSNGVGEASSGDSSGSGNGSGSGSGGSGKGNGSSGPCLNKVRCGSGDGHWPDLPRFSHIPLPIPGGCTEFGTAADLRGVNYCYMRYGQQTQSAWTVDALEEEAKEGAVPFNEFAHDFVVEGIPFFAKHHGDEVLQVAGATALVICVVVTGGGCAVAGFIIAGATVWDGNHYRNWDGKRTTAYIIFSAATLGTGGAAAEGASGLGARIGVGLGVDFPAFIGGWGIESGEP
jgi:RHS repeat-associated protein